MHYSSNINKDIHFQNTPIGFQGSRFSLIPTNSLNSLNGFGAMKTTGFSLPVGTTAGTVSNGQDSFYPSQSLPFLMQQQSLPFLPQQQFLYYQQQSSLPQLTSNNSNLSAATATTPATSNSSSSFGSNPTVAACSNEFCQLNSQSTVNATEKQRFLDQARQLGLNIVCVNCAQHDFKQILERVKQDGDIFLFVNSSKLNRPLFTCSSSNENSFSNTTIPADLQEAYLANQSQQQKQSENNQMNTATCSIPSLTSILTATPSPSPQPQVFFNPNCSSTNPTNNTNNQKNLITNNNININNGQMIQPQNNYMNMFKTQFNVFPSNEKLIKQEGNNPQQVPPFNFLPNPQQPNYAIPVLINQENNNSSNTLKVNLLKANHQLAQQAALQQYMNQQLNSQQSLTNKSGVAVPLSISPSLDTKKGPLPKQKHGLFKKTPSKRTTVSAGEFRVKVEGGQEECSSSGRDSHNNNLIQTSPDEEDQCSSVDSFSEENTDKKESRLQVGTSAADDLEKQNKIRERRKTNNFGHIYTWLKNQIRLYFGDKELYEKIQSYFTRVNKYNEVVTDESSSKWQYFLYQCKDNVLLKTFLKDKIKSEHFKEYIKTRKGKDQKVFYEFRIGVIYGIDHPELSNQPKNCLLMAKKDPEYSQICFGW